MRKILIVLLVGVLALVACGGDDDESESEARGPCQEDVPDPEEVDGLPANFPIPGEVVLTGGEEAGPSLIVEGVFLADIEEAFPEYKEAFEEADYDITKEEQEEDDAEIFFAGEGTTGQVNMFADCEGRTKLRITVRPD